MVFLAASSNTCASASSQRALSHSPCRPSSTAVLKSALLCAPGSRFGRAGAGRLDSASSFSSPEDLRDGGDEGVVGELLLHPARSSSDSDGERLNASSSRTVWWMLGARAGSAFESPPCISSRWSAALNSLLAL